ncbi:hypothetical protein [Myxococcus eversor]|nr:hypothetical protein [Myxococcus eversor]
MIAAHRTRCGQGAGGWASSIERNRFSGNLKAFSNTELRFHAAQLKLF